MDKRIKIIVVAVLLPVSVVVSVLLVQTMSADSHVYAQQSTRQQRIDAYKAKVATAPSTADLNKMKLRCGVAQTVFKNLETRTTAIQTARQDVYTGISKDLTTLQTVLKAKSIDTAKLDTQMKDLDTKSAKFKTDMTTYTQAVADAAELDCTTDPLAMKAAIQEARTAHDNLILEVADIRTTINNTIKPTLTQVKTDLQTQAAAKPTTGDTNAAQ